MTRGWGAALAAPLVALACSSPTAPGWSAEGAELVQPAPDWLADWRSVEACTGLAGDVGRVRWYLADRIVHRDGTEASGLWEPDRITLQRAAAAEPFVRRHEIVHQLTGSAAHGPLHRRCQNP